MALGRPAPASGTVVPRKRGLIKYGRASCDMNISEQLLRAGSDQKAERKAGKSAVGQARSFPHTGKSGNAGPCSSCGPSPHGQEEKSQTTSSASRCQRSPSCPGAASCSWGRLSAVCAASPSLVFFTHDLMAWVCAHRPRNVHHAPARSQCSPTAEGALQPAPVPGSILPPQVLHPILREVG